MPPKAQQQEAPAAESGVQQVRLQSLAPQQLMELRGNLNNEIQRLGEGGSQLARAANTCNAAKRAVEQVAASKTGQSIMLPLTGSMYVSGEVADTEKVLVDIGTGYYVEMSTADAVKYYERRIKTLQDSVGSIQATMRDRQNMLMHVQAILQEKMAAAQGAVARS